MSRLASKTPSLQRQPGKLTRLQLPEADSRQPALVPGAHRSVKIDAMPSHVAHTPAQAQDPSTQITQSQPHVSPLSGTDAHAPTTQPAVTPATQPTDAPPLHSAVTPLMQFEPDLGSQQWQLGGDRGMVPGPSHLSAQQLTTFGLDGLNSDPLMQPFGSAVSDLHGASPHLHDPPRSAHRVDDMQQAWMGDDFEQRDQAFQ